MRGRSSPIRILQVDPGLFTPTYDACLSAALCAAGHEVSWAVRGLRRGEVVEALPLANEARFYRGLEVSVKAAGPIRKARKGMSHLASLIRLVRVAHRDAADVVHFQWLAFPLLDMIAIRWLRRRKPVIVTVHDLQPYNGSPSSALQLLGFRAALASASKLVVHTEAGRAALATMGLRDATVTVIPHGPLANLDEPPPDPTPSPEGRWRLTLFGKLQPYKGVDVLLEALGLLTREDRDRMRVTIAGEALIPLEPLMERLRALDLDEVVDLHARRLDEAEIHDLFCRTDAFVFPYRAIEASGVLFLTLAWRRWMITTDLGAFRDFVEEGRNGSRVPVGDAAALAAAITHSIGARPPPDHLSLIPSWAEIADRTAGVYQAALAART